ncbi:MAG: TonB-dependent receptor [Saprospiraceae bacterium]|nr:TonB-dependent receptor [Saprospiraceae bacterium]
MKKTILSTVKKHVIGLITVFATLNLANAQGIKGVVFDERNEPLPSASILILGTSSGTVTDENGQFELGAGLKLPITLAVSSVGYETQELQITSLPTGPLNITLKANAVLSEVLVTARRRQESAQDIPIPISVISGAAAEDAGAFNVNRLKEAVPSVQLYSSNPRNTGLSIRGLGTTFGLTNDGIDTGVGFYVDGVYYARTAATTIDFIDVERIEVLRGPQGTLFGKNTTAGTFNVTTRKPSFTPSANFEISYGNFGFIQAKSTVTGPLGKKLAARLSFVGTQRDGLLYNVATQKHVNDLNNQGVRGQLLFTPTKKLNLLLAADVTRQRPDGYAQVFAGVAPTLRPDYRQFEQIIADLDYTLPSRNPFDRKIDHDTPWRSNQGFGGISLNADIELGAGTLTSTTAWRYWNWGPSNDRDFTGLQALALSQAPSRHEQWSQEVRWAGTFSSKLSGVFGLFAFGQKLRPDEAHTEESGIHQWRFSQSSTSELWKTPRLLDGFGIKSYPELNTFSGAVFGQIDWSITKKISLLPGIRFNYDDKEVDFRRETYGGLDTSDPDLLALKNSVYSNQSFKAQIDDTNLSGQLTLAYKATSKLNSFATFSTGFKPVGLNLGGLPAQNGQPLIELAVIKPESVRHVEFGIKSTPTRTSTLNLVIYNTDIEDYQTQVQSPELGVNRGYLANAEKVQVRGLELDANIRADHFSINGSLAYTDGQYVKFTNAPLPLEETGLRVDNVQVAFKDISGGELPGVSKWAGSLGSELRTSIQFLGNRSEFFVAADAYYRSQFSSSPSPSKYLVVDGYALVNARLGFRSTKGISLFIWSRNLFDKDYFEQLLPGAGNIGHYAGVLGDPRTFGVTLRYANEK